MFFKKYYVSFCLKLVSYKNELDGLLLLEKVVEIFFEMYIIISYQNFGIIAEATTVLVENIFKAAVTFA